ncbi:phosphopantetheine-binding protein, partial [Burkholderia pseudomallei]|uniref:phosphopantetheine-binding protein n=1 Tax=Burkholderia pseudomallei TaxID=28450 RepID=UPI0011C4C4FC
DASFASYGVDSIMAMALITALEKELGSLPKTLFFEHETIEELGAYLHAPERMHAYLRDKLSQVLKLPPERIEPDASFASYGVDSIMAMALITALEKELGS